jgi:hypothetical protein
MDLDDAIKKAVLAFYTQAGFATEYEKTTGKKVRHNKDFFDGYEKDLRKSKAKVQKSKERKALEEAAQGEDDAG